MNKDLNMEAWLPGAGATLDAAPDAPRGLYERLRHVAQLLRDAGPRPPGHYLAFRNATGDVIITAIAPSCTVGREAPADLILDGARMSRRHFCTQLRAEAVELLDLESRNGTYVNGKRVTQRWLRDGDIIEAGGDVLTYFAIDSTEA